MGSYRYRTLIEALCTLNSPPVVSANSVDGKLPFAFRRGSTRCH